MTAPRSERALVLAPLGRDASIACAMLREAGLGSEICADLPALVSALDDEAGFAVITEEALVRAHTAPLSVWLEAQPAWSDFPFILLTERGGVERNPQAVRYLELLANVTFVERPFHPTTLISLARASLRGRRKQYEARARLNEIADAAERYQTLFDGIDQGFCVIEFIDGPHGPLSDYVHVEANPAYERHAGIPNVAGKRVREIVGEEADGWIELYRNVYLTGEPISFERELAQTGRFLELSSFRIEPPERCQVAVLFQDATSRKKAEYALRDLNQTLEIRVKEAVAERNILADIVETTDSFVQVADLDYRWLAINRASADEFERIFGVRPQVGQSMLDVLADRPEHRAEVQAIWARALAGEEFTVTEAFGDPARDRPYYEIKFNTLRDANGERVGAFQIVSDVTPRLREQAQLAEAQDALRQAQKMEAIGQLTGGVAHDFNNMLTVIRSSADLLARPNLSEERRTMFLEAISETANRAAKLTQQLLAFSRRQPLKPEVFDAGSRVTGIAEMLRTLVGARVDLVVASIETPLIVEADISQFETALVNLCINARDAMNGAGTLDIGLAPEDGYVCLSVTDTGSGIAEDDLSRIFEPFFTTKDVGKGTGLGLSQVYGFAKQSGGDVRVDSEVGRGTTIALLLPRSDAQPSKASEPARASQAPQGGHVLVVEDNDDVRTFARQLLADMGFEVELAANGAQALDVLSGGAAFDFVFSDVVMEGMDGIALAEEIAKRRPGLPVILTSGYSEALAGNRPHGLPFLPKPYSLDELARVIAEARADPVPS